MLKNNKTIVVFELSFKLVLALTKYFLAFSKLSSEFNPRSYILSIISAYLYIYSAWIAYN